MADKGRKSKGKFEFWRTEQGLTLLKGWAMNGATRQEICDKIGVHRSTLNDWENRFTDISDAIKKGSEVADLEVQAAMHKAACGYTWEEVTTEIDSNGKKHIRKVTRHVPPNVTAQIFWMKTRCGWNDRPNVEQHEEYEDDGLIDAINKRADDVFADGDDAAKVIGND